MTLKFESAIDYVLRNEGGLVNHPEDPGGITNHGISLRFIQGENIDINHDGRIDSADIRALSAARAKQIYRVYWWDKYHYEQIEEGRIAAKLLDTSVWLGPSSAHKLIQIAVNRLNSKPIAVDGIFGEVSIAAVNETSKRNELLNELARNIEHRLINLYADNEKYNAFKIGWLRRALKIPLGID